MERMLQEAKEDKKEVKEGSYTGGSHWTRILLMMILRRTIGKRPGQLG
jgi:hypothetical protein